MEIKNTADLNYPKLITAFGEATKLSVTFVFFPVMLLLVGVWIDKKFSTLPAFTICAVVLGLVAFVFQVKRTLKTFLKKK